MQSLTGSGNLSAFYDPDTELVNIVANIKDQSFAGWGWGASMTGTEMVIFSADGDSSTVSYSYGVGDTDPQPD